MIEVRMKEMSRTRRALIFLCLAAILCAALTHAGTSLLIAFLVPIWLFLAKVISLQILSIDEHYDTQQSPALPIFSPRPPPAR
jgi:hypothetical protein